MLEKLLAAIRESGTTSVVLLAEQLGTTPAMITAMLSTLEDQGYLKSMAQNCETDSACGSCALSGMCSTKGQAKPKVFVME